MMLAREMTKIHQQFIRGTAGDILGVIGRPIGEMTIVVGPAVARESPERVVQDESVYAHFLREMDSGQPNRRLALERTASVMCLAKNEVYEIVERLKRGRIESERSDD
jgi:16S rRNA C1402 (ribose-2'-O) methylase RsmI